MPPELLLKKQPQFGSSLFMDMDSFFASVEQQVNESLRGLPVGVCPYVNDSTCILAASIEAKAFGVKTGTAIPRARELCPNIVLLGDNPKLYRQYHLKIMAALDQTRGLVSVKSIDEALLLVPHDMWDNTAALALEIKSRVKKVGDWLSCSVGISSNMFLSKMASNLNKPDGLVYIRPIPGELREFYSRLQLTDLHGIAGRMAKRLREMSIYTPLEFYEAPITKLTKAFGLPGQAWYLRLRGYEVDQKPTKRSMIGHQTTIGGLASRDREQILSIASQLSYKVATRLRASGFSASSIAVGLRYTDRTYWSGSRRKTTHFTDSVGLFKKVTELLEDAPLHKPVRLISVITFDLIPTATRPLSLFETPRNDSLSLALDEIEQRYGRHAIVPTRHLTANRVTDRIGFGNAPRVARELLG